jgi:transcriptional regulator with XRE-family HTH domain
MSVMKPASCRAARGLVNFSQTQLARDARVGLSTVKSFESGKSAPIYSTVAAMQAALEAAGVEFIPENGGGAGARLRDRESPAPNDDGAHAH